MMASSRKSGDSDASNSAFWFSTKNWQAAFNRMLPVRRFRWIQSIEAHSLKRLLWSGWQRLVWSNLIEVPYTLRVSLIENLYREHTDSDEQFQWMSVCTVAANQAVSSGKILDSGSSFAELSNGESSSLFLRLQYITAEDQCREVWKFNFLIEFSLGKSRFALATAEAIRFKAHLAANSHTSLESQQRNMS